MKSLRNKFALVTGAAGGLGRATAEALAKKGVRQLLIDRDVDALEELASNVKPLGPSVEILAVDFLEPSAVKRIVTRTRQLGVVDILINNAGVGYYGKTNELTKADWKASLNINLETPVALTQCLLPDLLNGGGHVVNVASMMWFCGVSRLMPYCTTKAALITYTECIRAEFGRRGVSATAICPGFINNGFIASIEAKSGQSVSRPPKWLCTTSERVARQIVRAIERDRYLVLSTPLGYFMRLTHRLSPGLLIWLQRLGRKKVTQGPSLSTHSFLDDLNEDSRRDAA